MIQIQTFTFNPLQENTYILYDETRACVIIDPGCYEKQEKQALEEFIQTNKLTVSKLLNTHGHIDHVLGNAFVKQKFGVELYIHPLDEATLRAVETYAPNWGFMQYEPAQPDHYLNEGDTVTFGNTTLEVLFVPGHAPGHIAFYNSAQQLCISGDVLFRGSIGRTDLPGGNFNTLIESIQTKLFPLGDEVVVYPGHGGTTTIGYEKKYNSFLT
ncbi:MBL fold metallo-hydrolase [Rhodocytophaga rosea]|uniref:MBL fold metallo-hydrolase n=1 Tax=Rhodocytophaga rosea TaxID=2704465 RepID=A0A6C0GG14_9BACT|nr:MBL fold metallo-hydrolase [Rhodocytophaga rosea]QHT66849.1 MBL fold metallo-hydrolase [Rhodocytophaga rosea]